MALRRAATRLATQLRTVADDVAVQQAIPQAARGAWRASAAGSGARLYSAGGAAQTRGPVSFVSLGVTVATGAGLLWWYEHEKEAKLRALSAKGTAAGQAALGGPFEMVDHRGRRFTDADLHGHWALLYFGFTHCPDVCPEELEKIAEAVDAVEVATGEKVTPVFLSVDPERDSVRQVAEYVREFHPRLVGLTGEPEKAKAAARAYRVYYTRTSDAPDDYLVDHSIITYLLNPDGGFVTFYGKNFTAERMAESVAQHVAAWREAKGKGKAGAPAPAVAAAGQS